MINSDILIVENSGLTKMVEKKLPAVNPDQVDNLVKYQKRFIVAELVDKLLTDAEAWGILTDSKPAIVLDSLEVYYSDGQPVCITAKGSLGIVSTTGGTNEDSDRVEGIEEHSGCEPEV